MFTRWELTLPSLYRYASVALAYVSITDAPQPRAIDIRARLPAGLGRFLVRERSFTIERIYAYKNICIKTS